MVKVDKLYGYVDDNLREIRLNIAEAAVSCGRDEKAYG